VLSINNNSPVSNLDLGHPGGVESGPFFGVAEAILDDPGFVAVLRVVLRDGYVMVPSTKARVKVKANTRTSRAICGKFQSLCEPNAMD
jgi:hypothetical protein